MNLQPWAMFALGVVSGWIILSLGIPALLIVVSVANREERLALMADNCALRAKVRELEGQ